MDALNAACSTARMRALWSDDAILRAMLAFEAELALAQADCGVIPAQAAQAVAQACAGLRLDALALATDARRAGTLAIPLAKALKAAVNEHAPGLGHLAHHGSTSQDVADTALVLVCQRAARVLLAEVRALGEAWAGLVRAHAATPLLARTLLQPAAPVSFGWKAAGWLDALTRSARALQHAADEAATLQFGGANGTLLLHGEQGAAVSRRLAERLGLAAPAISWHGARDRLARLAAELAILCGMLGKFGRDVSLLMQAEVAEAFEPSGEGRGGSSAMPHKRNPVAAMHMLDAAYRAPALAQTLAGELPAEHERGLGSWPNALPTLDTLFNLAANALDAARETAEGLRVDAAAMQRNIDRMHGVVYSEPLGSVLGQALGASAASKLVAEASQAALEQQRHIRDILAEHPQAAAHGDAIARVFDTEHLLAGARPMCEAVLAAWAALAPGLPATHEA
ncbi:3-carboxy-cis,cis-muconate cycloisomerase [Verticiella sediminum]|uniref:3-carboxy-cis,cis-muconate cycloisomerase n=1 Tax=Verticiella sediminum TaxID=1247510 RepID=A0A556AXB9_9BURK|nr:lyase family protein [Verticiella sediminum]TSH97590.1 3-carboxy-cis,cis-muconate cycloisomerase [Verticiella sediminum]